MARKETDWGLIREQFETTDASFKVLSEIHKVPVGTIKSRARRNKDAAGNPDPWTKRADAKPVASILSGTQTKPDASDASDATDELTELERRFVQEYIVDLKAGPAAQRAGYSAKTAGQIGYQLLQKTSIQEAIERAKAERAARLRVSQERVIEELAKVAFSDVTRFFDVLTKDTLTMADLKALSEAERACIAEVSRRVTDKGGVTFTFKLHDKKGALELLARHLGMLQDKVKVDADGLTIIVGGRPVGGAGQDGGQSG